MRMSIEITASNIVDDYEITFPQNLAQKMSYLNIEYNEKNLLLPAPTTYGNFTYYTLNGLDSKSSLKVTSAFTEVLTPLPSKITQTEKQYVKFFDNIFFTTPYITESQKTIVKLSTSSIISFTKYEPYVQRGSILSYGPYRDINPYEHAPLSVHYMNNFPFKKFLSVQREVVISHWGNIAVEEVYEVMHAGAELQGGFSRLEFHKSLQRNYQERDNSVDLPMFQYLSGKIPSTAKDVYYRDQIGNISQSSITRNKGKSTLVLETRYPMYGGWRAQFYIGYSMPTESALLYDNETKHFSLSLPFLPVLEDGWIASLQMKIILPERCQDVSFSTKRIEYAHVEQNNSIRYTFLDSSFSGGRAVLVFQSENLVRENNGNISVTYAFEERSLLVEPIFLGCFYFSLFALVMLFSRLSF